MKEDTRRKRRDALIAKDPSLKCPIASCTNIRRARGGKGVGERHKTCKQHKASPTN